MFGKVLSASIYGVEGQLVEVEVDLANGLPYVHLVGLPDVAVKESIERVRTAIKNSGYPFPLKRITINLAPADIRKEGSSFDLAIATCILQAEAQFNVKTSQWGKIVILGELSLEGFVRGVPGVLSMLINAKRVGIQTAIIPEANFEEGCLVSGIHILPIKHLSDLKNETFWNNPRKSTQQHISSESTSLIYGDYSDVIGQQHAKRALIVAASGMHNVLLVGPPGTGKTMLLKRLPSILPQLNEEESVEVSQVYSVSGQFNSRTKLMHERPCRMPHHSISTSGLIGGGSLPRPGEITLAHRGVLILDEVPEFSEHVLNMLRQPLEEGEITITRLRANLRFPASFLLACGMNYCKCGKLQSLNHSECTCSKKTIEKYLSKLRGPLLDRIELHIEIPNIPVEQLQQIKIDPISTEFMKNEVNRVHTIQSERFNGQNFRYNSKIPSKQLHHYCPLHVEASLLLTDAYKRLGISMRAHDRIIKVARTIADLDGSLEIKKEHLAEALQYRFLDRIHDFKRH